jgi:hypothetical protein
MVEALARLHAYYERRILVAEAECGVLEERLRWLAEQP